MGSPGCAGVSPFQRSAFVFGSYEALRSLAAVAEISDDRCRAVAAQDFVMPRRAMAPPQNPITAMFADTAALTPGTLSSMTTTRAGSAFISRAANRNRSGAGFPRATMTALKMFGSNRSSRPTMPRLLRIRSGVLLDATQILACMRSSAS